MFMVDAEAESVPIYDVLLMPYPLMFMSVDAVFPAVRTAERFVVSAPGTAQVVSHTPVLISNVEVGTWPLAEGTAVGIVYVLHSILEYNPS